MSAQVANKKIILESESWSGVPVMVIQSKQRSSYLFDKITYTK